MKSYDDFYIIQLFIFFSTDVLLHYTVLEVLLHQTGTADIGVGIREDKKRVFEN